MVLPAAITTLMIGVGLGVAILVFSQIWNAPTPISYEYPQYEERPTRTSTDNCRTQGNVQHRKKKKEFNSNDDCCICMNEFGSVTNVKHLRCGHFLHTKCYDDLIQLSGNNCPLCRKFI